MRIPAGRRNRLITFRSRTPTQSARSGAKTYTLTDHAQEWAEVLDFLPSRSEQVSEGIDISRRPCRIRCNFRDDITPDMLIVHDGRTLEIVSGPVEIGRRHGLEIVAVETSTRGIAP